MTMLNTNVRNVRTSSGGTTFAYDFKIYERSHIKVIVADSDGQNPVTKTDGIDYDITGVGNDDGGNIVFTSAVTSGKKVILVLNTPLTQATDLVTADALPAESVEKSLDYLASEINTLKALVARALLLPESTPNSTIGLAVPDYNIVANQSKVLKLTDSGLDTLLVGTDSIANPLTTKGDILGRNTTAPTRIPVGSDGQILTAASVDATGVQWQNLASNTSFVSLTTKVNNIAEETLSPIINGAFQVWQRGTSFAQAGTGGIRTADKWFYSQNTSGSISVSRGTSVPTIGAAGILFPYSYQVSVTVADTGIISTDYAAIETRIEGQVWQKYAQRDCVLEFWSYSPKAGTHSVAFSNAVDRSYIIPYTQISANTWQLNQMVLPATPSGGTWNYTTGCGLQIIFTIAAGSSYQGTINNWNSNTLFAASGQVNCLDNTSNVFRLAGVRLSLGSVVNNGLGASYPPFDVDLLRAMRYYQKSFAYATTPAQNTGVRAGAFFWPGTTTNPTAQTSPSLTFSVPFRVAPTMTLYNPNAANAQARNISRSLDGASSGAFEISECSFHVEVTPPATSAVGDAFAVHWSGEADLV